MHLRVHVLQLAAVCSLQLLAFAERANPANVFRSRSRLVREIRYTNFNITMNPAAGTVQECGIRSLRNKHMLYFRLNITEKLTEFHGLYTISKCKDYYVDCENVVSYNITNGCSKVDVFWYYTHFERSSIARCPFYGEYSRTNFTLNAEDFGAMFSYPMERWWELYWRLKVELYDKNYSKVLESIINFYFLEFRIREH